MLANFTVGNFLSFRGKKTLTLAAAPIKDSGSQIIEVGKHLLLPSAALYGANSSGKSNFLHAFGAFSAMVNKSSSSSSISRLPVIPFLLDKTSENIGHMKVMCRVLRDEADSLSEINASVYLEKMKELEKGGARFVNARMTDTGKRKTGAIISAAAVITGLLLIILVMLWVNASDPAPRGVIAFFIVMFAVIAAAVIYVLKQRLDEVEKGEIDEASKY